ncbi:Stearoyl-CoA desaturase 5 [Halotydeus destructor]|nr:Stearoyl-CoA desaturase 5 [Halotydeus destructor]
MTTKESDHSFSYVDHTRHYFQRPRLPAQPSSVSSAAILKKRAPSFVFVDTGEFSIVWPNVLVFLVGHVFYAYSFYLLLTFEVSWLTWVHCFWMTNWAGVGIGSGAHRLWAHKSYEARTPLRIFLMIGQLIAGQNCLYIWCRDHRVHHKFSDTDADPHNTKRGFFFAHVGWLLTKKHPEMKAKGSTLDMQDLLADPIVQFQNRHYWALYMIFAVIVPTAVPVVIWNETWWNSLIISYFQRYLCSLHCTWFVNSTAHMFGTKPYNKHISPVENKWVSFCTFGEGFHNYHHTFPWDYATSELGHLLNINKIFIDFNYRLGLAYNLRKPSAQLVERQKWRTNGFAHHDHSETPVDHGDHDDVQAKSL